MTIQFPWAPVTLERERVVYPVLIGTGADYDPDQTGFGGPLGEIALFAMPGGEGRSVQVGEILNQSAEEFRFVTPSGKLAVLRPTVPADAAASEQFHQSYDLPVEVIGAAVNGVTSPSDMNLTAAYDDEGDVHTLILETAVGLYARYGKQWIKLTDVGVISHLGIVNIEDDDLSAYDEADIAGNMVSLSDLHPDQVEVIEVIQDPVKPVTAAAPVRAVVVASAEDLPGAIRYAETDEGAGSRFYVERRCKAFGYPLDDLPWRHG